MLTKPWNLYIFRHSALTDKSQILPEAILRSHAGWTMSSKMPQVYIHLSGESSRILLEKRGILSKTDKEISNALKSKTCPNCLECNKPGSRFCIKCKMILSFDSYRETIDKLKEKEDRFEIMEKRIETISLQIGKIIDGMSNLDQSSKNRLSKDLFQSGFFVSEEKKFTGDTNCDSNLINYS
jgi:hypothetical protein